MDSLLEVGLYQYHGIGVKPDQSMAVKTFRKLLSFKSKGIVCEQSIEDAYYCLGIAYLEGKGVQRSISKARSMFGLADEDLDHEASELYLRLIGRNHKRTGTTSNSS